MMSPRAIAHGLCPLRELWKMLFEDLSVMKFDNWTTPQIRKDLADLCSAMNIKENVLKLAYRAQMLLAAAGFLAAKIVSLEALQDDIYAEDNNEQSAGYEYSLQRLRRLQEAAVAWAKVYTA